MSDPEYMTEEENDHWADKVEAMERDKRRAALLDWCYEVNHTEADIELHIAIDVADMLKEEIGASERDRERIAKLENVLDTELGEWTIDHL